MSWWHERAGLAGTVAIVLGGAGGLGEAISEDLAANEVNVAVLDRDAAAIKSITDKLGSEALVHTGDARDGDVLEAFFTAVDQRWDRLDTLVNVVGGTFRAPFTETNQRGWDALIRTNLGYVIQATSLAVPRIRAGGRGGSIVNLTTIEAHRGAPNFAVYSAAKAGVAEFARSVAVELAPDGIRINNVAADMTPTAGQRGIGMDDGNGGGTGVKIAIPMGRYGRPSDISNSVVFLASGLSSYITGTTLHPDGGTLASSGWFNWPGLGFRPNVPPEILALIEASPSETAR